MTRARLADRVAGALLPLALAAVGLALVRLDAEIDEGLHVELIERLDLCQPGDSLARAAADLPRVAEEIRRSQLGDLLCGRTDLAGFSACLGCSPAQAQAMLAAMGADRLVGAAR